LVFAVLSAGVESITNSVLTGSTTWNVQFPINSATMTNDHCHVSSIAAWALPATTSPIPSPYSAFLNAHVTGSTIDYYTLTTPIDGSYSPGFPRTEFRELYNGGTNSWSIGSGTHTLSLSTEVQVASAIQAASGKVSAITLAQMFGDSLSADLINVNYEQFYGASGTIYVENRGPSSSCTCAPAGVGYCPSSGTVSFTSGTNGLALFNYTPGSTGKVSLTMVAKGSTVVTTVTTPANIPALTCQSDTSDTYYFKAGNYLQDSCSYSSQAYKYQNALCTKAASGSCSSGSGVTAGIWTSNSPTTTFSQVKITSLGVTHA